MDIATLANKNALTDLKIFLFSLQLYNDVLPKVYVYCDSFIENYIQTKKPYKGEIYTKNALEQYVMYTRKEMEHMPGNEFRSKWEDFMCEKMNLLDWAHETSEKVLMCDADICFLGTLPKIPEHIQLGLSPHVIREADEEKFGKYNGGFVFSASKDIANIWRKATHTSRYFEQAALEDLTQVFVTYEFPIQNNYGWWRLLQGKESIESIKLKWSMNRIRGGLMVDGEPLLSVHTHWSSNDSATKYFNSFLLHYLSLLKSIKKIKELHTFLLKN